MKDEVFITDCPPVRQTQRLDITLDENEDCEYSFHVIVNPSVSTYPAYSVMINSLAQHLVYQQLAAK